ncbi:DUF6227 family protein [Streptomyces sp.]|uniref:DUF6227 family protein n=1 Tax=Streptomyces sp. TaxID=1931 RepID=UPI002F40F0B9
MDAEPARAAEVVRSGGRPAEQLAGLLERAENREQAARYLAEVRSALMHYCGLQSCRHAKGPPRRLNRRTFRHSFLLPDGDVRVVWELEHNTRPDGAVHHAVFADREDLTLAEWAVDIAFGGSYGPPEPSSQAAPPPPALSPGDQADDPAELDALLATGQGTYRRAYTEGDSAEHARRLLRRAANANAPGHDVLARLRAALAHDISIVTRRSAMIAGRLVSWSLYEHAFLLLDGSEVSLWEIDHTRTPSGEPVCEVYASQDAALDMAVRRIEAG